MVGLGSYGYTDYMRKAAATRTINHRLSLVAAAIIILMPFQALLSTWLGSNTGHLDLVRIWKEILIVLMLPAAAWLAWRSPPLKRSMSSDLFKLIGLYIILHLLLGFIAIFDHRVTTSALIYSLIVNLRFLVFFGLCYVLASNSRLLADNWAKLLLWPAAVVLIFGIIQLFLPYDFLRHFGYGPNTIPAYQTVDSNLNFQRIQSTLRGANPLGAYLVIIIPAIIVALRGARRLAFLVVALAILFFSYSRSAWLGLFAALGLLALLEFRSHRLFRRAVAAGLVLVVVAAASVYALRTNQTAQDTLFHTSSSSTNSSSNNERAKAMEQGFSDVVHQPLGGGPGTAGPASNRNTGHLARIAENYYLQIGQEAGWVGIFLFLAINYLLAAALWARRAQTLPLLLLVSLFGITVINLVSHAWTDDTLSLLWWGLAGTALASTSSQTGRYTKS